MDRENFGSKLGAVLAAAGSAVGLGNIWRFPIETGENGGAAFIVVYIISIMVLGLPIMISEFLIGRYTHSNTAGAYRIMSNGSPWKWVGRLGVFCGWFIMCYYIVVGAWTLYYAFLAVTNSFAGIEGKGYVDVFDTFVHDPLTPSIALLCFVACVHVVVVRGVQSGIEKSAKMLMPALFIITVILAVCSVSLPGASKGVEFLLKPDWSKVDSHVILQAMGQAFYSLSLGMGCLCTYASYFDKSTPLAKSAVNVSIIDTVIAVMAGFIIFPSVFNIGMSPEDVGVGASLTFISLPNVFQQAFGNGSLLAVAVSTMFYLLLFVAALTSAISLHEVATAYVSEEFHCPRKKAATIVTSSILVLGMLCSLSFGPLDGVRILGYNIFEVFDNLSGMILLPVSGLLISIFAGWVIDKQLYRDELTNGGDLKARYFRLLRFCLRYVAPAAIGVIFLDQLGISNFLK